MSWSKNIFETQEGSWGLEVSGEDNLKIRMTVLVNSAAPIPTEAAAHALADLLLAKIRLGAKIAVYPWEQREILTAAEIDTDEMAVKAYARETAERDAVQEAGQSPFGGQ